MEVFIVTGASKGLGAALVDALLSPDARVIGIARTPNDALADAARARGAWLDWYLQDFADVAAVDTLAAAVCSELPRDASRYVLVNNAGTAEPLGPMASLDGAAIAASLNVNLTAAFVLTARFLAATADLDAERRVLNVSSGLARRPRDGFAVYASAKAGLDMLARSINAEPDDPRRARRKAKAVSLAPGVLDTAMQGVLRGKDRATFPEGRHFATMHAEGRLVAPDEAARKLVAYLARDDFGSVETDDVRNA